MNLCERLKDGFIKTEHQSRSSVSKCSKNTVLQCFNLVAEASPDSCLSASERGAKLGKLDQVGVLLFCPKLPKFGSFQPLHSMVSGLAQVSLVHQPETKQIWQDLPLICHHAKKEDNCFGVPAGRGRVAGWPGGWVAGWAGRSRDGRQRKRAIAA